MNQVALVGRITKDPILRRISEGRIQTSFVLAVNRSFKNHNGEIDTDFVLCTMWGRGAENMVKHCGKGSLIGVGGRIQSRTYEREDKSRVYVTEVIGEDIRFIATKRRSNDNLYGETEATGRTTASTVSETKEEEHFNLPNSETEGLPIF
ncbi:single-stranded DNA-binding protein [Sporosarcina beigongshangi]|uniref:single-stranded DNA-binding protein n=1 Tax=Sporosarcina beigongshangi TaxID=2782538 RepID=UPI001939E131|nr:single-stranded DNA-binding protein [Sporosarcina beigongshangi]